MSKFEVGSRVICLREWDGNSNIINVPGTILDFDNWSGCCRVKFDKPVWDDDDCWTIPINALLNHKDGQPLPDLIYVEGFNHKIMEKVKRRDRSNPDAKPIYKYFVISTLYNVLAKNRSRHFRVFQTDKTFDEIIFRYTEKFVSIDEAKRFIKAMYP